MCGTCMYHVWDVHLIRRHGNYIGCLCSDIEKAEQSQGHRKECSKQTDSR